MSLSNRYPEEMGTTGRGGKERPKNYPDATSSWQLFARLLQPHRQTLAQFASFLSVATAIPLASALVLQRFIDAAVRKDPTSQLVRLASTYVALGLLSSGVMVVVVWKTTALAWRITDELRHELAEQVLSADLAFHRDHTRGDLVSRADDDVTAMALFISQFVARAIAIAALAIAATLVLLVMEPKLAAPFGLCMTVSLSLLWFQRDAALPQAMEQRDAKAAVSGLIEERISGSDDIRSLGAGAHSVARLAHHSERIVQAVGASATAMMTVVGRIKVSLITSEVTMLIWGGYLFTRGSVSIGTVVLGVRFATAVRGPIEQLSWRLQDIQGATGSATRVLALRSERKIYPKRTQHLPDGPLDLAFHTVSYTYDDGDEPVLDDVSISVAAGRSLGLVGRSGSGKTSLGRLALRLLDPSVGRVTIGGSDLQTIDESDLRERVTSIPQEVQLFPGSVKDNVTMFTDRPPDEVIRALTAVGLGAWLNDQPEGIEAQLLSRSGGAGLSAGEAQLLALARALVRNPSVVILDEATSRIDPETQSKILKATQTLLAHRTSVVIAHRLETLAVCDDIAVLSDGRIVEFGRRVDLVANPTSHFARLLLVATDLNEVELDAALETELGARS